MQECKGNISRSEDVLKKLYGVVMSVGRQFVIIGVPFNIEDPRDINHFSRFVHTKALSKAQQLLSWKEQVSP